MGPSLRSSFLAPLAIVLGTGLIGCSESTTLAGLDAGAGLMADGAADGDPTLPPCVSTCDRVAGCFVEDCAALDWRAAGAVYLACNDVCDPVFAAAAAGTSCGDLEDLTRARTPDLALLCDAPCDVGCGHFADCAVDGCDGLGPADRDPVFAACSAWCTPDAAGDLLSATCANVVTIMRDIPEYAMSCGAPAACPGPMICDRFAAKVAGCIVDHCAGNADPYEVGITAVLFDYCSSGMDCPTADGVAFVLDGTCDTPPLDEVGPAAPFTAVCDGTLGASSVQVTAACERIMSCGVPVRSRESCEVLLSLGGDPAAIATCVNDAVDCMETQGCLGGP